MPASGWHIYAVLTFEDQREYDLPGLDLVDDIGVLQVGVPAMDIFDPLAELQLGREDEHGHIDLEADAGFYAQVGRGELYQVLCLPGGRIGCQVIPVIDPSHHIDPEIPDTVREEFQLCGEPQQEGLYLFGSQLLLPGGRMTDVIRDTVAAEDKLGEGEAEFEMIGEVKGEHTGNSEAPAI